MCVSTRAKRKIITGIWWAAGILIVVAIGWYAYCSFLHSWEMDEIYDKRGAFASYFNSILGPFIGLVGVVLTFFAFFVQYRANKAITDQQHVDQFEQRFFEMLKIHRENAEGFEIEVSNLGNAEVLKGKKAFRVAALEVEVTMALLTQLASKLSFLKGKSLDSLLGLSYLFVYWGVDSSIVGPKSKKRYSLTAAMTDSEGQHLMDLARIFDQQVTVSAAIGLPSIFLKLGLSSTQFGQFIMPNSYMLWRGHHYYWSHYIRQLLRIFEMLAEAEENGILDRAEGIKFSRILRSQLSNDEQKLIYYYSQSNIGQVLWSAGYMTRYIPFKNINIEEIPTGIDPKGTVKRYLAEKGLPHSEENLKQYFDFLTDYV